MENRPLPRIEIIIANYKMINSLILKESISQKVNTGVI